jgi:hypothetical protein
VLRTQPRFRDKYKVKYQFNPGPVLQKIKDRKDNESSSPQAPPSITENKITDIKRPTNKKRSLDKISTLDIHVDTEDDKNDMTSAARSPIVRLHDIINKPSGSLSAIITSTSSLPNTSATILTAASSSLKQDVKGSLSNTDRPLQTQDNKNIINVPDMAIVVRDNSSNINEPKNTAPVTSNNCARSDGDSPCLDPQDPCCLPIIKSSILKVTIFYSELTFTNIEDTPQITSDTLVGVIGKIVLASIFFYNKNCLSNVSFITSFLLLKEVSLVYLW